MTLFRRPGRRTHRRMMLVACGVAALCAGCQEADKIAPKDQKIALGALTSSVCPDQDSTLKQGVTTMIATVFAKDGTLADGVGVTFSSAFGGATFDPVRATTNPAGIARSTLSSPRPPGDSLTMTATLDNGLQSSHTLGFPLTPIMTVDSNNATPLVGVELLLDVGVSRPCNITELGADLSYDPTVLEYEPGKEIQLNALNDVGSDGSPNGTTLDVDSSVPGHVRFRYFRDDGRGVNITGGYLRLSFKTLAAGDAQLAVVVPSGELIGSVGGAYDLYPASGTNFVAVAAVTVISGFR